MIANVVLDGCYLEAPIVDVLLLPLFYVGWFPQLPLESTRRMLKVCLSVFHTLLSISSLLKKSPGAFRAFMARLRDACLIVNLDIKEASVVDFICAVGRVRDI